MKEKFFKIIESKAFILIISVLMIVFGFYYWSNFSGHIDNIADSMRDKLVKSEFSFDSDIEYEIVVQAIDNELINSKYNLKSENGIISSKDISDGKSKLYYQIEKSKNGKALIKVKFIVESDSSKQIASKRFEMIISDMKTIINKLSGQISRKT